MINFFSENAFRLTHAEKYRNWLEGVAKSEDFVTGELNYIFCDDAYLLTINKNYLNHDTYTDIISFDYVEGSLLNGDIFISTERIKENAQDFGVTFDEELRRVMAHGILHLMGYKDKSAPDKEIMRNKEDEKIKLFHVEQSE
ncbi:rRNA maturation RNase YbeY [Haloflavibacter putidus]|uniref:Endoribonuclease YbeY n=1 Tax=Haloflavibacter putidus TaxID=2576776 RepID=A0A507ZVV2_9FLAO|nr:rRNA maturation RNase YbeY [Haloflavibacter putidus]TQD40731.1 rRNA maturation RNase YbeY [Haloflavibacter putidus]